VGWRGVPDGRCGWVGRYGLLLGSGFFAARADPEIRKAGFPGKEKASARSAQNDRWGWASGRLLRVTGWGRRDAEGAEDPKFRVAIFQG
jgi:hypothetical protein